MALDESLQVTFVDDDEFLYRSVKDDEVHHLCDGTGKLLRLGSSAFNDPHRNPSVDRARFRENPSLSCRSSGDGVVKLQAIEVRGIRAVITMPPKQETIAHDIDVRHNPIEGNPSHALIVTAPHVSSDGAWKKLKEALSFLAFKDGWVYPPASARG